MSMLDSFFAKGFKASKCKTLLKLTIPRIKLLRNRKELQLKQMRRDIAKLLETGQEATARIRVEHIIRDENMMAAQEILELYCELIAVRLPIIESQRECPLDLKEAISSICFAAPRCADLPELLQVQMSFASKYGKEFVAAATELMPNCGVNRQLIELLSVRAPPPEKKLKLLKEIAEEHEIDWDPAPSETELFKSHEDLLNGPSQFVTGSKVPLPSTKHDENLYSASVLAAGEHNDSEDGFDDLEFPEVPKVSLRPGAGSDVASPQPSAPHQQPDHASATEVESPRNAESVIDPDDTIQAVRHVSPESSANPAEQKQFLPFLSPPLLSPTLFPAKESSHPSPSPSMSPASFPEREINRSPPPSRTKSDANLDLNDILAAAKAAAESAERAAVAARSAASLAELRISELSKSKSVKSSGSECENPFFANVQNLAAAEEKIQLDDRNASGDYDNIASQWNSGDHFENNQTPNGSPLGDHATKQEVPYHQPQRLPSMDDDTDFSYPNLFSSKSGNVAPDSHFPDNSQPRHGL